MLAADDKGLSASTMAKFGKVVITEGEFNQYFAPRELAEYTAHRASLSPLRPFRLIARDLKGCFKMKLSLKKLHGLCKT